MTQSEELDNRIKVHQKFLEEISNIDESKDEKGELITDPLRRTESLIAKLRKIDSLLKRASVPWGRGGDKGWYAEAMMGWEKLLAVALQISFSVLNAIKKDKEGKFINPEALVRKLKGFLTVEVFQYAYYIEDTSYYEADVAKKHILVIQQPPVFGQQRAIIERGAGPEFQRLQRQWEEQHGEGE